MTHGAGRAPSGARALAAVAALSVAAPVAAQLPPVFIGTFQTTVAPGFDPAADVAVTLRLHPQGAQRARGLGRWLPGVRVEGGSASFRLHGYPVARDAVAKAHRAPSFFVDWDEPAVRDLRPAVVERYGERPTAAELSAFVDAHLEKKNLRRIFDPASVAAQRREGDCTEHAVLLTALARLFGHPARMISGLAVVKVPEGWMTLGHAWTEVHDGTRWTLEDATHPPGGTVLYLPLSALEDEGPGYAAAAVRTLSPLDVASVELSPAPPGAR